MIHKGLGSVFLRLPRYGKLLVSLSREPALTPLQRATLAGAIVYTFSPVDVIPGVIPLLGQVDDLVVLFAAIRQTVKTCPVQVGNQHLHRAGLTRKDLEDDHRLLALTARAWTARAVVLLKLSGNTGIRELYRLSRTIGRGGLAGLTWIRQMMAGFR